MTEKVQKFKIRRMNRLLDRMDADDDEKGHWVTTENNHHIHINENGVPDKGNPYVVAAMTGKKPRVGLSDKQKKIASLLDKEDSGPEIREELEKLPVGTTFMVRSEQEYWRGVVKDVRFIKKDSRGDYIDEKTGQSLDDYDVQWALEHSSDHDFDLYTPDEDIKKKVARKQKDFEALTREDLAKQKEKIIGFLSQSPEKARIDFPEVDGPFIRKKDGDSYVWFNRKSGEKLNDAEIYERMDRDGFGMFYDYTGGVKYTEPKIEHTSGSSFAEGHKVFEDTASGTHEYRGTGKKTVDFFSQKSNCDELIQDMDLSETRAFQQWTWGHFMSGQQYQGWNNMSESDRRYTKSMDNVLDRARLDEPIVLTRLSNASLVLGKGNKAPLLSELRAMKGKKIVSKGAMSCAAAGDGLTIGSHDKLVEYKISVPSGEGYGVWVGDKRINDWGAKQREFVLNRDVQYEVGNSTYNANKGIFEVELKLVRRLEHDYGD